MTHDHLTIRLPANPAPQLPSAVNPAGPPDIAAGVPANAGDDAANAMPNHIPVDPDEGTPQRGPPGPPPEPPVGLPGPVQLNLEPPAPFPMVADAGVIAEARARALLIAQEDGRRPAPLPPIIPGFRGDALMLSEYPVTTVSILPRPPTTIVPPSPFPPIFPSHLLPPPISFPSHRYLYLGQ